MEGLRSTPAAGQLTVVGWRIPFVAKGQNGAPARVSLECHSARGLFDRDNSCSILCGFLTIAPRNCQRFDIILQVCHATERRLGRPWIVHATNLLCPTFIVISSAAGGVHYVFYSCRIDSLPHRSSRAKRPRCSPRRSVRYLIACRTHNNACQAV